MTSPKLKLGSISLALWTSLIAQLVNNPPAMQETLVRRSPGEGIGYPIQYSWAYLVVKNAPAMWETWV